MAVYVTDHLPEIKVALDRAGLTLAMATSDGDVPPDVAARLEQHIGNATRETMRANDHLEEVVDALRRTSQALPGEEDLARTAQTSVDSATAERDSARRATFRIVGDLPIIERDLKEISVEREQTTETLSPIAATTAPPCIGQLAERRRAPDLHRDVEARVPQPEQLSNKNISKS